MFYVEQFTTMIEDYAKVHAKRFELSLEWLAPHLAGADVVELGGSSPFTDVVRPKCRTLLTIPNDLRYDLARPDAKWDLCLCMEVIEHVADQDGLNTEWRGSGVDVMLAEAKRMLKPGGFLFVSTPNAASITAIHHALRLAPPMLYRPHVREYAPYELDEIIRKAGFNITRRETFDLWRNAIDPGQHKMISQFIYNMGYPVELRGEDIFLLAQK